MTTIWMVYAEMLDDEPASLHPTRESAERFRTYCLAIGNHPSEVSEIELSEFRQPQEMWMSWSSWYSDDFGQWVQDPKNEEKYFLPTAENDMESAILKVDYTNDRDEFLERCHYRLHVLREKALHE